MKKRNWIVLAIAFIFIVYVLVGCDLKAAPDVDEVIAGVKVHLTWGPHSLGATKCTMILTNVRDSRCSAKVIRRRTDGGLLGGVTTWVDVHVFYELDPGETTSGILVLPVDTLYIYDKEDGVVAIKALRNFFDECGV